MECLVEQQEEEIILNSINESSIRNIHEAISSIREDTKNSSISELGHEPHLLLIGAAGTGKSALAGVFINGKSGGKFGPKAGTEDLVITTPVETDDNTYYVHDTRGLGDSDVDIESMKIQVKEIFETNECLVILCVRWDSRFVDTKTKLAFEICGSLSPDIWSKVVIAITHFDRIPPEIECLPLEQKTEEIQRLKDEWIHVILSQHPNINEDHICFTSHTEVTSPIDLNWKKKFHCAIVNAATCLSGALRSVYSKLSDEGFMDSLNSLTCCFQYSSQQFAANIEDSIQNVLGSIENITDHDERGSDEENPSNEFEVALNDFFEKVESQLYSNMLICGSIGGTVGTVSGALTGTVACGPVGGVVGALIGGGIGAVIGTCLGSGISVHVVKAGMLLLWLYLKKNE